MNTTNIKVSVLLVTYNHELYIREALDSILMQAFEDYEIVVADDRSTDSTLEIIKEYAARYPDRFVFMNSPQNLGITKNYQRGFKACRGEYIAVLEGDDYWSSPNKLSMHIDFLDKNRECVLSFNRYVVYDTNKGRHNIQPWPLASDFQYITITDLIRENFIGNFSTCVYRADVIKKIDDSLFDFTVYDWMLNIVMAQYGLIGYLGEVMSVYRLHSSGTWSNKKQEEKLKDTIRLIDIYDNYLENKYTDEFGEHKSKLTTQLYIIEEPTKLTGRQLLKYRIKSITPPIVIQIMKWVLPPIVFNYFKRG
ncbi:glycosyltransferase [Paenibacillus sp. 1P03SA]|uniref:glycosyltransferase n=1 Tax=Paenibacillus sp. 1P03SA TaxID=3132294 RepID=UPI0039A31589